MRYFFEIAYNGSHYHGWQNQLNATGVQQMIEEALSKIFRDNISIVGSGRTDTGVHCTQQFFHTDIDHPFAPKHWMHRINSFLPGDIAVRAIVPVRKDAHARYDARERTYVYKITTEKNPLLIGLAFYYFRPLNIQTINKAAALLCGTHDFRCFSKVKTDVNHFICDVKRAHWTQNGANIQFTITANRFLRGMVRSIVGTLSDVGSGKTSLPEFKAILNSKDRRRAGANVPAEGLYLTRVKYPARIFKVEG